MITIRSYIRAASLDEAYALNQKRANRIIAGMMWTKMSSAAVNTAIDLSGLGLDTIEESNACFSIGAMVTLRQLEQHEGLNTYSCGTIREALRGIVGVQFRNMATVGGTVWGRFGFSDLLTVLSAMDCEVELYRGGIIPLAEFVRMKHDRDVLVRIIIHKSPAEFAYESMRIASTDLPVLTCAVSKTGDNVRTVIGARPGRAMIVSCDAPAGDIEAYSEAIGKAVPTGGNVRGSAAYRKRLARVLTARCLKKLEETER